MRRWLLVPLVALLVLQLSPPASALPVLVPTWAPAGTITLSGLGYGHGRGLSQYGAKGAAEAQPALTADQIVAFYYPGTTLASFAGSVKVLITKDNDKNTLVLPRPGLQVRDVASGATTPLSTTSGVTLWRLRTLTDGTVELAYLKRSPYTQALTWYRQQPLFAATGADFVAPGLITLRRPDGDRRYRGVLRQIAGLTVNVLVMDSYVRGVVPAEMPASWPAAALQAQAIAARSYAAFERASRAGRAWELYDDTRSQVYGGYSAEDSRTNAAVDATPGQYLLYQGQPAYTQFSASNGGYAAGGAQPYLPAKADPYDKYPRWTTSVSTAALQQKHPEIGTLRQLRITKRDGHGYWGGRVLEVELDGSKADIRIGGVEMRTLLGLRSTWFWFS